MQSAMTLPMTLPAPVSAGSIESYIQAVNRIASSPPAVGTTCAGSTPTYPAIAALSSA